MPPTVRLKLTPSRVITPFTSRSDPAFFAGNKTEVADDSVAQFFYAHAIALRLVSTDEFKVMCKAIKEAPTNYEPPSVRKVSEGLLDRCVSKTMKSVMPIYEQAKLLGGTLASDGYTDASKHYLCNVMFCTPIGNVFRKMFRAGPGLKTADWLHEQLCIVIDEIGPELIYLIVLDGASVNVAAGKLLELTYPHVTCCVCCAHGIDLLLKDACKHAWAAELLKKMRSIVKWVLARGQLNGIFNSLSPLKLLLPGATRFASHVIVIERYLAVREYLKEAVLRPEWAAYIAKSPNTLDKNDPSKLSERAKGQLVQDYIEDKSLATSLRKLHKFLTPCVIVLRLLDTNAPCMGSIYPAMYDLKCCLEKFPADPETHGFQLALGDLCSARWNYIHIDMMAAGYILNPRYRHLIDEMQENDEVWEGFLDVVAKLTPNPESANKALTEFSMIYKAGLGSFASEAATFGATSDSTPAYAWWDMYGRSCTVLRRIAMIVLSRVPASSSCERNWSNVDNIMGTKRTLLTKKRLDDLVYCYANMRVAKQWSNLSSDDKYYVWCASHLEQPEVEDSESDDDE